MAAQEPLNYGHYHVHRRADGGPWVLGVGGMGVTYKAVDTRLHVDVALKVIHPARIADPDAARLFIREARAAAKVYHPNVAPVVFLNDEPGRVFYAMEYVDGVSLYVWLRKQGSLSVGQALAFAEQIAAGLGAIHEHHLVHRDLKPANVMVVQYPSDHPRHRSLTASGGCHLKIIDFGLARGAGEPGSTPDPNAPMPTLGFRGTAGYASPEQCEEHSDLDGRSDLYALGCMLWEFLRGRPPFVGKTHRELLNQQVAAPPPWAELQGFPEAVVGILRRLLAKRREDRFPDAATAVEAIALARRDLGTTGAAQATIPRGSDAAPAPGSTLVQAKTPTVAAPPTERTGTQITVQLPAKWWVSILLLVGLLGGLAIWVFAPRTDPRLRQFTTGVSPTKPDAETAARRRFIAVLPFNNITGEKETDYFADGIHDDILTTLAKVRDLRVISRATAMRYRGKEIKLREIANELGVGAVLEGSVRRSGNRVRVTTQLIDVDSDQHLWAETYDREITDIFEIQSAVAKDIARSLEANLTPNEQKVIDQRPTRNTEAYELYREARVMMSRTSISGESRNQVARLLERAIALDKDFALAHAQLSRVYAEMFWFGIDESPERVARARELAERAARLRPDSAEAHVALGEIFYRYDRNFESALREFRTAVHFEPSNPVAVESVGFALRRLNRWEESTKSFLDSARLSPDDAQKQLALAEQLFVTKRPKEALPFYKKATDLSGNRNWEYHYHLCQYEIDGDWDKFVRRVKPLFTTIDAETRWMLLEFTGDEAGALRAVAEHKGDDIGTGNTAVPKSLVTGLMLIRRGDLQEGRERCAAAVEALRARVAAHPKRAELRIRLAQAYAGVLDREAALREGEQAMRDLPESADPIAGRHIALDFAEVCALLGEADRACEILERMVTVEIKFTRRMAARTPAFACLKGFPRFDRLIDAAKPY
ncbi:MAG: protein kinase [Verrucomicrobia bacterium]|nr:protein kinase [Verrucomicrobiota bacterium]